jgi:hypothetical protein
MSQVTITELKNYANVYHTSDDSMFSAILIAGKTFISSYTGLPLTRGTGIPVVNPIQMGATTITGTSVTGYTVTVTFPDGKTSVSATAQADTSWSVAVPTTITLNDGDVISVVQKSPAGNVSAPTTVTVDNSPMISPPCIDDYEDLTIALWVISAEMYDNRTINVENDKLNFVIRTILDSHSVNFI